MRYVWSFVLVAIVAFWCDLNAQSIVTDGLLYGIQNSSGQNVVAFEYDSIVAMDNANFYVLTKGEKTAFYFEEDNFLTPCVYELISAVQGLLMFEKEGKKGCITSRMSAGEPKRSKSQFVDALYDEIYILNGELLVCRKGEDFYLFVLKGEGNFDHPVVVGGRPMYDDELGLYFREINRLTLIRNADVFRLIPLEGTQVSGIDDFVYEKDRSKGELRIWSNTTGELLGAFRDSLEGKIEFRFREDCMCVWKTDRSKRRVQDISWLIPYGGNEFFSIEIARKADLRLNTIGTERDMSVDTEVYVYSHTNYESCRIGLGTVRAYVYTPFPTKRVEIEPYSSSSGKKPFFMPGKN